MIKKIAVVTLVGVLLLALTAVTQADKGGNKDGEDEDDDEDWWDDDED